MTALDFLNFLDDLNDDEFENFHRYLKGQKMGDNPPIKECQLSNPKRSDVGDLMVQTYGFAGAVEVMKNVLTKIGRNDLVTRLPTVISGAEETKISIVVLGTDDHLKKNLISLILWRDVFAHRTNWMDIDTYENDTYEVTFTPNMYEATEDIRKLFSSQRYPDMCLLVVEDEFTTQEVWQQIEKLHKITEKPTEDFIVVLPLRCKTEEPCPFKFCTMDGLFSKLRKLAKDRSLMPTNNRSAEQTHTEMEMDKSQSLFATCPDLRIVMIGKTGVGKSAVGNTILGEKHFTSCPSSESVTATCEKHVTSWDGRTFTVVDTPGILDTSKSAEFITKEIVRCVKVSCPGPHVFLLVIQVGRFTTEEKNSVEALQELFGPNANQFMIVLFTRGGDLGDMSIQEYVSEGSKDLRRVIESCGDRFHVFDNTNKDRNQVLELIKKIDDMVVGNRGKYYTDAMYKETQAAAKKHNVREDDLDDGKLKFAATLLEHVKKFLEILGKP